MSRMTVERMARRAHGKCVEGRRVALFQIHGADPGGGLIHGVDKRCVRALPRRYALDELIAGADPELGNQRHFDRQALRMRRQPDAGK